jgi:hypothetical protein
MEENGSELKFVSPNGDIITSGDDTRAEEEGRTEKQSRQATRKRFSQ